MRIGIDMDGVLCDWCSAASFLLNSKFGYSLIVGEHPNWDYIPENVKKEHWDWLWDVASADGFFQELAEFPQTKEALATLEKLGSLHVITSRPRNTRSDSLIWLGHLGIPFASVHFEKEKWKIPVDVFLDDKPETVVEYKEHHPEAKVVLWTRRYNQGTIPWSPRVKHWTEFIDIVKEGKQ